MPDVNVRDGGVWKPAKEIFVRDGGIWKTVKEVWVRDAGVWKQAYPTAPGTQNYTSPGAFSFTVPNGIYTLSYTVYGAGGGSGANNQNGDCFVGGGGGAGGKSTGTLAVTPGEVLTINVGTRGYGASFRFNSDYAYNPNNSTLGYGTAGGNTTVLRGVTTLVTSTGGTGGYHLGGGGIPGTGQGIGGVPTVANTVPRGGGGDGDGERANTPGYFGYGYQGPIYGGTNASGTPPSGSNRGSGYGNGGGQYGYGVGIDGQDGAVLLSW